MWKRFIIYIKFLRYGVDGLFEEYIDKYNFNLLTLEDKQELVRRFDLLDSVDMLENWKKLKYKYGWLGKVIRSRDPVKQSVLERNSKYV